MYIPDLFDSWAAVFLYLLSALVLALGIWQVKQIKSEQVEKVKSLVPIGGIAVCIGFIGNFIKISEAFQAIEAAGDITPELVASALNEGPPYLIFGFAILSVSYLFKFVNQR